jgi:hypothetical protein
MALHWVSSPARVPHRCAFLPTIAGFHPKGFVQGTELDGLTAYISIEAVEQIAAGMGWAPQVIHGREVARLRERVADLERQVQDRDAALAAVEVLKNTAFEAARRPGRPRKQTV